MIPPVFTPKNYSSHQIGIEGSISCPDKGDEGERIIYNLIKQLGELRKIGMIVINGFLLQDITKWNKGSRPKDFEVSKNGEFDFIIFHHTFGVISLEVKNYSNIKDSNAIPEALRQLEASKELIRAFATYEMECDVSIPHTKVIAMPSTNKCSLNLGEDILLLFKEDTQNIESFQEWWQETLEKSMAVQLTQQMQTLYETALSYTMMIRHLHTVTEPECVAELYKLLNGYTCHKYAAYQHIFESEYPKFWSWCWRVLSKKDGGFDFGEGKPEELKKTFMKSHGTNSAKEKEFLKNFKGIKVVEKLLKPNGYITSGESPSKIDEALAELFEENYFLFYKNILHLLQQMPLDTASVAIQDSLLERYPFLMLESCKDLNMLDRYLSTCPYVKGDKPSEVYYHIFEKITSKMTTKRSGLPMVFTSEQLAVFEGPLKQLIIGPPGSGKTDLLKFKARELAFKIKKSGSGKEILYIIANGSPKYKQSLVYYHMKEFFRCTPVVKVVTIVLKEESHLDLSEGKYDNVFIDEYWIGSKPAKQKIIIELVDKIKGYMWISSVFDYSVQPIHKDQGHTGLLAKLEEKGGVVNRVTTVLRAYNSIIDLERGYSSLHSQRSYPYGTKQIRGHSLEGFPVTWVVEDDVCGMYTACADIVQSTVNDAFKIDCIHRDDLILNPDDILVVNFAVRMDTDAQSLDHHFCDKGIQFLTVPPVDDKKYVTRKTGKVTLLQSLTRDDSSFIDGAEWPMVVVILPSGMLLNTAKLTEGAQPLRNYDSYISFFRAMVKLVVISDKWRSNGDFLKDIAEKLSKK